jgi:hypothetical protein
MKKTIQKPRALIQSISPYKILDGIFKPLYILIVQNPKEFRHAIITSMTYPRPVIDKEQVAPFATTNDIITRRYYKVVINKQDNQCKGENI